MRPSTPVSIMHACTGGECLGVRSTGDTALPRPWPHGGTHDGQPGRCFFCKCCSRVAACLGASGSRRSGCDEITVRQASITLEQLRKVQAPFPEEQQRTLIQLRKLSEAMRVQMDTVSASADPNSAAYQLRDTVHGVLDGCVSLCNHTSSVAVTREIRHHAQSCVVFLQCSDRFCCFCQIMCVKKGLGLASSNAQSIQLCQLLGSYGSGIYRAFLGKFLLTLTSRCRGEVRQLVLDREMLRQMHATAVAARNHVEAFFCDCLLDAVRELLPDDVEPAGADLRATVIVRAVEAQEVPDVAPEEELVAVLSQLVEALKVCIALQALSIQTVACPSDCVPFAPADLCVYG